MTSQKACLPSSNSCLPTSTAQQAYRTVALHLPGPCMVMPCHSAEPAALQAQYLGVVDPAAVVTKNRSTNLFTAALLQCQDDRSCNDCRWHQLCPSLWRVHHSQVRLRQRLAVTWKQPQGSVGGWRSGGRSTGGMHCHHRQRA